MVLSVLQPLWNAKTITAQRLMQRIASILDFATAAGYRSGSNPARWKGHLEHLLAAPERLAKVEHHAALPYVKVPAFVRELRNVEGIPARAFEFMVLTAARTNEVRGATWDDFDLDAQVWTVPALRMKARTEHQVPLSRQAIDLLRALPREGGNLVFIGAKAGAAIGKVALLRVLKPLRPGITVHGFRSSFRTWTEERTAFPAVVAEQALAHTVGSAVERSYRRTTLYEQRQRLMQQWADFIDTPVTATKVTPLRRI
jgi:integrase